MSCPIDITKVSKSRISEVDFENIPFGKLYSDHMFIADYKDGKWQDCRIMPYGRIPLSPATSAIHYGQSFFEGLKAYKDKQGNVLLFRPEKNFKRLNHSAWRMAMPELPQDIFMEGLKKLIELDKDWIPTTKGASLYIRPFMFATDEYIGVKPAQTYRFMIFTCPVGPYYAQPVRVKISDRYVRAFEGGTGTAKAAGNYAATMLPVKEANLEGYDQILWVNGKNLQDIQEIGTMNVFFVIDGKVVTPQLNGTILEGVTRDSVITLLKDRNIAVEERNVTINEVLEAHKSGKLEDAFGTGTAATIAQIACFGYKGTKIEMPAAEERELSNYIRDELYSIRRGEREDKFGWVVRI